MKTFTFSLAAASLVHFAIAQPAHMANLAHRHKRDVATVVDYVTASATNVMVYVDQNGVPQTTSTIDNSQSTDAPVPAPAPAAPSVPAEAAPVSVAAAPSSEAKAAPSAYAPPPVPASSKAAPAPYSQAPPAQPAAPTPNHPSPPPSGAGSSSDSSGLGINYSPYNADNSCKSSDDVSKDFEKLSGYSVVRSYGVDCNQVVNMINVAKAKNMKIMLGVYHVDQAATEAAAIVAGVKATGGDWGMVHSISVGNEAVNSGQASPGQVTAAIQTARGILKAGGFNGKVVTVDTFDALIAHPELCQASDYAAANAHAFFDADTTASQAGTWARGTAERVKAACGGKDVILTESGWPTQGSANGAAVPGQQNQQTAISSLKSAFPDGGLFLFSAFNDLWKQDFSGSFGCEKYWGIYGDSSN